MTIEQLEDELWVNTETLSTTEGDSVACISIKDLETILTKYLHQPIKIKK